MITILSRKYKLPREYWREGKSKFLLLRLRQEGLSNLCDLHNKYFPKSKLLLLKLLFFEKLVLFFKRLKSKLCHLVRP